jgi:hypothetical protein
MYLNIYGPFWQLLSQSQLGRKPFCSMDLGAPSAQAGGYETERANSIHFLHLLQRCFNSNIHTTTKSISSVWTIHIFLGRTRTPRQESSSCLPYLSLDYGDRATPFSSSSENPPHCSLRTSSLHFDIQLF